MEELPALLIRLAVLSGVSEIPKVKTRRLSPRPPIDTKRTCGSPLPETLELTDEDDGGATGISGTLPDALPPAPCSPSSIMRVVMHTSLSGCEATIRQSLPPTLMVLFTLCWANPDPVTVSRLPPLDDPLAGATACTSAKTWK
jgi:hypothetical protein